MRSRKVIVLRWGSRGGATTSYRAFCIYKAFASVHLRRRGWHARRGKLFGGCRATVRDHGSLRECGLGSVVESRGYGSLRESRLGGARGECRRPRELVGKWFGIRRGMAWGQESLRESGFGSVTGQGRAWELARNRLGVPPGGLGRVARNVAGNGSLRENHLGCVAG